MTLAKDKKAHWEEAHRGSEAAARSWFQAEATYSLALVEEAGVSPRARVIDVGGGTSRLMDGLLDRGFEDLTVLDISAAALEGAKRRLGSHAPSLRWIEGDILSASLGGPFDLWHDRAVYHFLTEPSERAAYRAQLLENLSPEGYLVLATFALDGPERCSGLPVVRYSAETMQAELGSSFALVRSLQEAHITPAGREQRFSYGLFRRN